MVRCEECGKQMEWWKTVGWLGKRVCKQCKEMLKEILIINNKKKAKKELSQKG